MGTFPAISQFLLITFEGNKRKTKFPLPQNIASYFPVVIYNCLALTSWYISLTTRYVCSCASFSSYSRMTIQEYYPSSEKYSTCRDSIFSAKHQYYRSIVSARMSATIIGIHRLFALQIPFSLIQFKIRYQILFD